MTTSSARPDDLDAFAAGSRVADQELRGHHARLRSVYGEFQAGTRWGHFDAESLVSALGRYVDLNEIDAQWVARIAAAFRAAGGDGDLVRLPDAAIQASLRAAGLDGGRASVTFDDPVAYGFPPTTGYADDPVNTASGNFLLAETDLPSGAVAELALRRTYNSRSDQAGAFGPGWSGWADARLLPEPDGARYIGPDGQRALFPRQGAGYGRVLGVRARVEVAGDGLVLRWFDGRRWEFDGAGRPVRIDRGPGGAVSLRYAAGRLAELAHTGGRSIRLGWAGDRIVAAVASDGREIDYRYDDAGALIGAGDRSYEVDEQGRVLVVRDADGVATVTNGYDNQGRVREQISRFGHRTRYAYLPGRVTVTGDDEITNTYVHDAAGRLLAVVDGHGQRLSRTYDEWGNPVTVTDRNGAVETMEWDDRSRPVRRTLPGGVSFTYRYDDLDRVVRVAASTGATVSHRYVGAERVPVEIVDGEGGVTRLDVRDGLVHRVADPDGVTLSFGFDADGALVSTTDGLGGTARLERDAAGRIIAAVTALGRRTEFGYDPRGRLVERRDPAGGTWRYEYTDAGRLTAVVDPLGARRETHYGPHGEAESTVDPLGHVTTGRYDEFGHLVRVLAPDGAKWEYTYDALSRITAITDPAGSTWLREYDVTGNLVGVIDPVGTHHTAAIDDTGRVTGLSDGLTSSTFEFDPLGRAVAHVRPDGTAARAGYDRCGRRTTIEDPAGGVTRVEYTPAGRIRRTVSPGGRITTFEYDAASRRVAVVDGAGRRTEFRYDADGALLARVRPGGTEEFRYDDAGRLVSRHGPGRRTIHYGYDTAGRLVAAGDRTFGYDAAGHLIEAVDPLGGRTRFAYHERGWLTSITDPLGAVTTRRYDEVGRVIAETDPLGRTTTWEYDAAGRPIASRDGSGRSCRWSYDPSGRITSIRAGDTTPIVIERDALGRPVEIREADAVRHRLRWDAAGRLVERRRGDLALGWRYGPDGERTARRYPDGTETGYSYDGGGLVTALRHPATGQITLRRDAAGRLTGAEGQGLRASWRYDDDGLTGYEWVTGDRRRTAELHRDATGRIDATTVDGADIRFGYDAAGQLVTAGDRTFGYDAAGRLIRETSPAGEAGYRYDAAGQLTTRVHPGTGTTTYAYDGTGRRTTETTGGARRAYRWDALGRLAAVDEGDRSTAVSVDALGELAEVGGSPVLWDDELCWLGDRPVLGWGTPWATPDGDSAPGWLAPDWQGTPGPERDPWGAPAGSDAGPGFRGELEFAGLTWLRNRAYHPDTRGFLTPDPMPPVPGTAWSAHPYHYAGNDPIGRADPLGLRPVTDAELRAYRDELGRNAWEKTTDWVGENWEYLAAGAMVVGGVALMFTGVGGPAGIALMAASGGLIAGGASAGIQKFTTGEVDWGQVAVDGLIGAAGAGAGAGVTAALGSSARLAATNPLVREMALNGAESLVSGGLERGLTGGDIFSPRALAGDLLTGGTVPAPGGALGAGNGPGSPARTLFHYTDEAGQKGILDSGVLNPSLKAVNPKDARYGDGQYLSDIAPGTRTNAQLSRAFLGAPFWPQRFSHYLEVDVSGLEVIEGRPGVFVVPGQDPLDLTGRIVSVGTN